MKKILELKGINKSFSGIKVLHNVDLSLREGEVLCLVGENGAGKSTLIKILSGAEKPDNGDIILFDKPYDKMQPSEAIQLGIATIYQDADLVDTLTVSDNIFLGSEMKIGGLFVNKTEQDKITKELLDRLNIKMEPDTLVEDLSPGQKQNLQVAKALYKKAKIIIMDEPTSSLGEEETASLMELIDQLKEDGIGIIYISHYFEEVYRVGDRALVLKDGHSIRECVLKETTQEQLIKDMVGRNASNFQRKGSFDSKDKALKIKSYSGNRFVRNVNFTVSRGEIFGLGGLVGAGRTELVRMLFGADNKDTGQIYLDGEEITPSSPKDAIKKGFCYVSEERKTEGLFLERSVKENISVTRNENKLLLNLNEESKIVNEQIKQLNIKVFNQQHEAGKLSGGNQQKVVISRWISMKGEIYIFDEPSKGVDIGAREEIYWLIEELARQGKIILMVSSSMPELLSMSDRIGVMKDGVMTHIFHADDVTEDKLLKAYMGVGQINNEREKIEK